MTLEAGRVEARIGADIGDLEKGVRAAEAALRQFAVNAQRSLDAAFAGRNIAPAVEHAARDAVTAARRGMESQLAGASEAFSRGLIDRDGLAARAKKAGDDAAKQLRTSMGRLSQMGLVPPDVARRLEDDLTEAARKAGEEAGRVAAESMGKSLSEYAPQMEAIGQRMTLGLTAPILAAGGFAVKSAVDMERLEMGLSAVAGSADEAGRQLVRLEALAREPGLGFREAIQGSINLQAVGLSAERSERALLGFGRAVALTGGGAQELDRIFTQLGQSAAVGRVLSADWRPIIQTAPAVAQAMRDVFGTIDPQEIEAQGLSFDEFFDRLVERLEQIPPVAGGGAKAFEEFADATYKARVVAGDQLLPAVTDLVNSLTGALEATGDLSPETVRLGIAMSAGAAAIGPVVMGLGGLARAYTAVRLAGLAALPVLGIGGALVLGVGGVAAMFVKAKLDALAAAAAFEEAMQRAAAAGAEFDRANVASLNAALSQARAQLRDVETDIAVQQAKLDRAREEAATGTSGAMGLSRGTGTNLETQREIDQLSSSAEVLEARIAALVERRDELLSAPAGPISNPLAPLAKDAKELAAALRTLSSGAASASLLSGLEVGLGNSSAAIRRAADETVKLQAEFEAARDALVALGAAAPAGSAELVADLGRRAAEARAELERMVPAWQRILSAVEAYQPNVSTIAPLPAELGPVLSAVEREYALTIGSIREQFARGLIDQREMERQGREAAAAFNQGLLLHLDTRALTPEVRAEILATLKLDSIEMGDNWRDFASGAAVAAQGLVNVADAFGDVSDSTRRTLTGLSELSRSIGSLQSGPLLQMSNLTSLVGVMGGLAQIGASMFGGDPERARREQDLTRALGDLQATMQGFRVTMSDMERAQRVQADARDNNFYRGDVGILEQALERHGMTLMELDRVAQEFGLSIYDSKGRIDTAMIASAEFADVLQLAIDSMTGWRNTVGDARAAAELEAKLWGGSLTEPLDRLQSEIDIFTRFFAGSGLGALDVSTEEGREQMRALMQTLYGEFQAGTLDLQDLTRDEFLSLFDGMADGLNAFEEATRAASRGMLNVPPIFDLALRERMAGIEGWLDESLTPPSLMEPGRRDPVTAALEGLVDPVEGVTDSFMRAWEQLSNVPDLSGWQVPDVGFASAERAVSRIVEIQSGAIVISGAGRDAPQIAEEVVSFIERRLTEPGTNSTKSAVRRSVT